jgi:hypothetical protein
MMLVSIYIAITIKFESKWSKNDQQQRTLQITMDTTGQCYFMAGTYGYVQLVLRRMLQRKPS